MRCNNEIGLCSKMHYLLHNTVQKTFSMANRYLSPFIVMNDHGNDNDAF